MKDAQQALNSSSTFPVASNGSLEIISGRRLHQALFPPGAADRSGNSLSFQANPGSLGSRLNRGSSALSFEGATASGTRVAEDEGFTLSVRPNLAPKTEKNAKSTSDSDDQEDLGQKDGAAGSLPTGFDIPKPDLQRQRKGDTQLSSRVQRLKITGDSKGIAAPETLPRSNSQNGKSKKGSPQKESAVTVTRGTRKDAKDNDTFIVLTAPYRSGSEVAAGSLDFDLAKLLERIPPNEVVGAQSQNTTGTAETSGSNRDKNVADIALSSDDTRSITTNSDVQGSKGADEPDELPRDLEGGLDIRGLGDASNQSKKAAGGKLLPDFQVGDKRCLLPFFLSRKQRHLLDRLLCCLPVASTHKSQAG